MFEGCIKENDKRKIFTAEEDGKKYTLLNNSNLTIEKIKIDKCVFYEEVKKCDWLFWIDRRDVIFVELKGSDITQGVKQLYETYENLKNKIEFNKIWFRLSVGSKNSVPKSIKNNILYKKLFFISKDNIKIGKNLNDII